MEPGEIYFYELLHFDFSRVRLVVLAACSTAAGRTSRSEGPLSLSLPFLARGVGGVVSTLWDVDDLPSARFVVELHRQFAESRRPSIALRDAKLAFLKASARRIDAVRVWAPFELTSVLKK